MGIPPTPPKSVPGRHHPAGRPAAVVNFVFCLVVGLVLTVGLRALIEWFDREPPEPLLIPLFVGAWIGGYLGLGRWHSHLWGTGRRGWVIPMLLVEGVCVPFGFAAAIALKPDRYEALAVFAPHAAEYMALKPEAEQFGSGHLPGHCVVVSDRFGDVKIDIEAMDDLPRPARARTLAEVKSVVQLRWGRRTQLYPEGAWVETCAITILDADTRQLLARTDLVGKWHEVRPKGGKPFWTGAVEWKAVSNYLKGLPREP